MQFPQINNNSSFFSKFEKIVQWPPPTSLNGYANLSEKIMEHTIFITPTHEEIVYKPEKAVLLVRCKKSVMEMSRKIGHEIYLEEQHSKYNFEENDPIISIPPEGERVYGNGNGNNNNILSKKRKRITFEEVFLIEEEENTKDEEEKNNVQKDESKQQQNNHSKKVTISHIDDGDDVVEVIPGNDTSKNNKTIEMKCI